MAATLAPDTLEIVDTETPTEQEQDQIGFDIDYYPSDFTLKGYYEEWHAQRIILPEFQRAYVWDQVRASKLIESFLLGLPVPGVFLYRHHATKKLQVIDGHQRIITIIRFFDDNFNGHPFKLKNINAKWDGKTFEQLSEPDQIELQHAVLRATIVRQLNPTDNSSIYHVFERLNTGAVRLSPMELRKCVYSGEFFAFLEELNQDSEWRTILGSEQPDKRLRDVELVLRFIAMREGWQRYEKPMKTFLNSNMANKQSLDQNALRVYIDQIRGVFNRTCATVVRELGARPFHRNSRALNPSLLDSVMVAISTAEEDLTSEWRTRYDALLSDDVFNEASVTRNTSDTQMVKQRFARAQEILLGSR